MCDNAKMDFTDEESKIKGISEDHEDQLRLVHSRSEEEKGKRLTLLQYQEKKKEREQEKLKQKLVEMQMKSLREDAERSSQSKPNVLQKSEIEGNMNKVFLESKTSTAGPALRIRVDNQNVSAATTSTSTEIQRDIVSPDEIILKRRKDEGTKPIFDRDEVKLFDQVQREREHEIFQQKQIFVYELKKLVKLLFPEEHSGMSSHRSRRSRSKSRHIYPEHQSKTYSPESPTSSKSSVTSEKAESINGIKEPVETVESEISISEETAKNGELQNDTLKPEESTLKQNDEKDKSEEAKPALDPEELGLLDEWQKEIDARRQIYLKKAERRRRSRSRSRSRSPYYRSKSHSFMTEYLTRDEILYREYERSRERHEREKFLEIRDRIRSRELRASDLPHYIDSVPLSPYYESMSARMMPMRTATIRNPLPGGPRLPFPTRFMHPGMSRPYMFPPGI